MKNELIQDLSKKAFMLAHEANDIHEQEEGEELSQTQFSNVFNQKLIELTVRECVIRAEREWIRNGLHTEHNQAVSKVIESIKQHFGVEE